MFASGPVFVVALLFLLLGARIGAARSAENFSDLREAKIMLSKIPSEVFTQVKHPATLRIVAAHGAKLAWVRSLAASLPKTYQTQATEFLPQQRAGAWLFFTAVLIALGLGGLHALEWDGNHAITAGYLASTRQTAGNALLLGLLVTVAHAAAMLSLGAAALYASRYIVAEPAYPWLGVLFGATILGLGALMLIQRLSRIALDHDHGGGRHWFLPRRRRPAEAWQAPARQGGVAQLLLLRMTSNILVSPAALVVLLSAITLSKIAQGLLLLSAFGVGMATVYACRLVTRPGMDGPMTERWSPILKASFVTILGAVVAWQGFAATSLHTHLATTHRLRTLLFVIGLGLVLGMRHSTDADHVVAISTIVSRQRSIRGAAFIGSVWGIGHTITIFVVGSLIILFNIEIPVRLGLSMEFSVAVMLVLLGITNLTGAMQWVTQRLTAQDRVFAGTGEIVGASLSLQERVLQQTVGRYGVYQFFRPLVIGLVHGLAGSAAVALLVLSTIHDPVWATFYLLVFGAGTLLGMMCMTAAIAVPLKYAGNRSAKIGQYLNFASGMASLCFGSFLVYQLGFVGGLFSGHPQWTPQ